MNLNDLFKPKKDILETEDEIMAAERSLNMVGDIARKCLQYDDFGQYKRYYERVESELVETMIKYTKNFVESDKGDCTKYALTMVRLMTKLQDYRFLLRQVELDSKKDVKKEEKP